MMPLCPSLCVYFELQFLSADDQESVWKYTTEFTVTVFFFLLFKMFTFVPVMFKKAKAHQNVKRSDTNK